MDQEASLFNHDFRLLTVKTTEDGTVRTMIDNNAQWDIRGSEHISAFHSVVPLHAHGAVKSCILHAHLNLVNL
jgi:hypothetical protein